MKHNAQDGVSVELSRDEAIVLFEWLAHNNGNLPVQDHSEQVTLWRLEGKLEKLLVEPISTDYAYTVSAARRRIRGEE